MESLTRLVTNFEPEGVGPDGPGWQQKKSAQTRVAILDAAIDCLATHGYANTTTLMIAETAGVSRGAMLHHYPAKADLIKSIIAYSFYRRSQMLVDGVKAMSESNRVEEFRGLDILWKGHATREFRAYLELSVAARTDSEVRDVFIPQARRFSQAWREESLQMFPEWAPWPERLALANDFVESTMEGLALNSDIWGEPGRIDRLVDLVRRMVAKIYAGEFDPAAR